MSKIPILGDVHAGARVDSEKIYHNQELFYKNTFLPYVFNNNVSHIIQTGDLFDNRIRVNTRTLQFAKRILFNPLRDRNITFHSIAGNHDAFYKDSLKIVTGAQVLREYDNVRIYSQPTQIAVGDGVRFSMIPWICKDNEEEILDYVKNDTIPYCVGHFELMDFQYSKSTKSMHGMDAKFLENYKTVISGHYHTKSQKGNILYVGSPTQNTWEDCDDTKGFWVFDTNTKEIEFIENPYNLYETYTIDSKEKLIAIGDKSVDFNHKYVKIFIETELTQKEQSKLEEYLNKTFSIFELSIIQRTDKDSTKETVNVAGLVSNRELVVKYSTENSINNDTRNKLLELYDNAMNNMRKE